MPVFQFTRPQGARRQGVARLQPERKFQFTRPQGARRGQLWDVNIQVNVSIHAPARGATDLCGFELQAAKFQFTRPQGARHWMRSISWSWPSFNSRARKGRDLAIAHSEPTRFTFQFTRPQGARHLARHYVAARTKFQFTRPQGARRPSPKVIRFIPCFNSRARKGRDGERIAFWNFSR